MTSRRRPAWLAALIIAASLALAAPRAGAGTIDTGVLIGGPGLGSAAVPTVSTAIPNNDDVGQGTDNTVAIQKSFTSIDPIDILFTATNSGGATEYRVTETITNNSPVIWFDYHLELGFGGFAGTPSSPFEQSMLEDKLDFDTCFTLDCKPFSPAPTSSAFATVGLTANELSWSGGQVKPGETVTFVLSVDVPESADCVATVPACPVVGDDGPTGFLFTFREFPTITGPVPVPAPAPLMLLGLGVTALGAVVWRRRRS